MLGKGLPVGRVGQSPSAICGSRRGVGDSADPESPEGQAARDGQGRVGLLQRGDRPLGEEAGGRLGAQRGGSAGQSAGRKSGAARSPHPGVGSPGEAGRGGARRSSEVPGSGSAGGR